MGISSGLYNAALTLYSLAETDDGQGGTTSAWTSGGSFRGRISSLSSQEKMAQDKLTNIATHKIFCDNMSVLPDDRIYWGTVIFEITGIVNPSEAYHHLEIYVRELVII